MTTRVLGLFAKWPEPGRVKTRLAADTSPMWAAAVALAFLQDLTERLNGVAARRLLAFAPADAEPLFADLVRGHFGLVPQADGDLGRRLSVFMAQQLAAGAGSVVVLGSDSPTVPPAYVEQAFAALEQADVILGPATDGGYYLIGCARWLPSVFDGIAWGGPMVLAETIARVAESSGRLALLPPWYDVDTLDDWRMLRGHVAAMRLAGIDPGVPHIEALCRDALP
jgi:rSAM/selenodomain-associated transferase 1